MSYFNDDQEDYMRDLAKLPTEKLCGCGWYEQEWCERVCAAPHKKRAHGIRAANLLVEGGDGE